MSTRRKVLGVGVVAVVLLLVWLLNTDSGRHTRFILGGGLVNVG